MPSQLKQNHVALRYHASSSLVAAVDVIGNGTSTGHTAIIHSGHPSLFTTTSAIRSVAKPIVHAGFAHQVGSNPQPATLGSTSLQAHEPFRLKLSMPSTESNTSAALDMEEARAKVLLAVTTCKEIETIKLTDAAGRTSAGDITARHNIPHFRNSAMDGYAVRYDAVEVGVPMPVAGVSLAGHPYPAPIENNQAVRITTGAQIPSGADTIVIQENTSSDGDTVTVNSSPVQGQHNRHPGDDIEKNQTLVKAGQNITVATAGLLAGQGFEYVDVIRQPRVGLFSTGDELCDPGSELGAGQIYDSNRITLASMLRRIGAIVDDLGIVRDNRDSIEQALNHRDQFDFMISSGGVSVGEADFIKSALQDNAELLFWKIAMKPGKPLVSARLKSGAMYFGLPGNPVSSMVTCAHLVIPAIMKFAAMPHDPPRRLLATNQDTLTKEAGRFEFQRGIAISQDHGYVVQSTGAQDSHVLSSMSAANCFICLPRKSTGAAAGSSVEIILFSDLPGLA
jgi:molybdopterin molybdotransferase